MSRNPITINGTIIGTPSAADSTDEASFRINCVKQSLQVATRSLVPAVALPLAVVVVPL